MKRFFKELFEYNHHFNQELLDVFSRKPEKISGRANQLLNHTLNAHQIWNYRIKGSKTAIGVWDMRSMQDLGRIDQLNFQDSLQILDAMELNEIISYSYTTGRKVNKPMHDILFHVINHSTYHRGQIALEFRKNGLDPLKSDYIAYQKPSEHLPSL